MKLRSAVFYSICMPLRVALVLLLYYYPLHELILPLYAIGFGFIYQYGKNKTKGFFNGNVYWPRMKHAILYFIAASFLLYKETRNYAYILLAIDIFIGLFSHASYYLNYS